MKVYAVIREGYDTDMGAEIVGVFTTREACQEALDRLEKTECVDEEFTGLAIELDSFAYVEEREKYAEEF